MRFQELMPDILHWLGVTKIDRMLSMSNMKHDAIVNSGIPILERIPIPDGKQDSRCNRKQTKLTLLDRHDPRGFSCRD